MVWIGSYVYTESVGFLMYGMVRQTFMSQCFIIEFDHEGKFLWRKQFYVDDNWPPNRLEDLQIVDGKLVMVVSWKGTSFFPIVEQKAWLVRIGRYGETSSIDNIVNINKDKSSQSVAYPNPTSGLVKIKLHDRYLNSGNIDIKIFNVSGHLINHGRSIAGNHRIQVDLSGNSPGLYFAQITSASGVMEIVKIIKS